MTEPAPDPAQMTDTELNAAIIQASRDLIAAWRARDPEQIAAADAWYQALKDEQASRG